MDPHISYILPLKGLKEGFHQFSFDVNDAFFQAFEDSPIAKASVQMSVELDKKPRILVLDFSFDGTVQSDCDRCLTTIQLPVKGVNQLVVKFGELDEQNIDEDVVYIPFETNSWSIAQYVYEYILLAVPLIKTYDCENDEQPPCDFEMLKRLELTNPNPDEVPQNNPFGDALKGWNK